MNRVKFNLLFKLRLVLRFAVMFTVGACLVFNTLAQTPEIRLEKLGTHAATGFI